MVVWFWIRVSHIQLWMGTCSNKGSFVFLYIYPGPACFTSYVKIRRSTQSANASKECCGCLLLGWKGREHFQCKTTTCFQFQYLLESLFFFMIHGTFWVYRPWGHVVPAVAIRERPSKAWLEIAKEDTSCIENIYSTQFYIFYIDHKYFAHGMVYINKMRQTGAWSNPFVFEPNDEFVGNHFIAQNAQEFMNR